MKMAALVHSNAVRALRRQPLRPRSLGSDLPISIAPLPSSRRLFRHGADNLPERETKQQRKQQQSPLQPKDRPKDIIHNFSLPKSAPKDEVVHLLAARAKKLTGWLVFHGTIADWGFTGDIMKRLASSKRPTDYRSTASPRRVIAALMDSWCEEALPALNDQKKSSRWWDLDNVCQGYEAEGKAVFDRICLQSFLSWLEINLLQVQGSSALVAHLQLFRSIGDLRYAPLKFTAARSMTRHIHLHVGPTNSGKTHGALVALCKSNTGVYAGPLRLLAHEVWDRINSGTVSPGIAPRACNLKTGEEIKVTDPMAGLQSCTVEMVNVNQVCDVAVIDEIQMIGDPQRGHAWTTAVLGLAAKELHLCGEKSVVPLIKKLAEACGDKVVVHEYERLTPLRVGQPLGSTNLQHIQKGDCIVAFSRSEIFRFKKQIEEATPFKCALAYGALPPETKSEQAKTFNDPENDVSVMVASDAIGMGLNLKIKRIIFASVTKWNGSKMVPISASQIKQIAGRAGRFGTTGDEEQGGYVTTLHPADLPILEEALKAPLLPVTRAAIQPSSEDLATLSAALPIKKALSSVIVGKRRPLKSLYEDLAILMRIDSRSYFACSMEQQTEVAPILESAVPLSSNMTIAERELFAVAPANTRDERLMSLLANMVSLYARSELVSFAKCDENLGMMRMLRMVEKQQLKFEQLLFGGERGARDQAEWREEAMMLLVSDMDEAPDINLLMIFESLHRGLTLYLWLSFRLPLAFCYRAEVEEIKVRAEKIIDFVLEAIKVGRRRRLAERGRFNEEELRDGKGPQRGVRQGRVSDRSTRNQKGDRDRSRGGSQSATWKMGSSRRDAPMPAWRP